MFTSYLTAGNHIGRKPLAETGNLSAQNFRAIQCHESHRHLLASCSRDSGGSDVCYSTWRYGDEHSCRWRGQHRSAGRVGLLRLMVSRDRACRSRRSTGRRRLRVGCSGKSERRPASACLPTILPMVVARLLPETELTPCVLGRREQYWLRGHVAPSASTLPGDVRLNIQKGDVISDGIPVTGSGRIDEPGGL